MPDATVENASNLFTLLVAYGGVIAVAFWVAMIIWAYRDMRARSRDPLAQILVALMVAVLTIPGLLIYILLRPRETLSESYERSLEEEALLQEIEEKPTCPGCGQRTMVSWQVCPYCRTRLKKPCMTCNSMLELAWDICPYCSAAQTSYDTSQAIISDFGLRPTSPARSEGSARRRNRPGGEQAVPTTRSTEGLEFIDTDEY
jgi:hypothetical protein